MSFAAKACADIVPKTAAFARVAPASCSISASVRHVLTTSWECKCDYMNKSESAIIS